MRSTGRKPENIQSNGIAEADTEKTKLLEERMRPGRFSRLGFLGQDESLSDMLRTDDETVKRLGLTHDGIADRLEHFINAVNGYPSRSGQVVDGKYLVSGSAWRGSQECPYGDAMDHGSLDLSVENQSTGEKLSFPGGIVHLIRAHHFYEGVGSPYRVDPEKAARVLDIG